jgi:hypothetical protein
MTSAAFSSDLPLALGRTGARSAWLRHAAPSRPSGVLPHRFAIGEMNDDAFSSSLCALRMGRGTAESGGGAARERGRHRSDAGRPKSFGESA